MKYRRLGATDLTVSEIGFGTWGLGGNVNGAVAYGPTDDSESMAALRRAFDLGITFYDTSDFYGFGHSEEVVGEALRDVRSRAVIATKVGLLDSAGAVDFSPFHIRRALEASLRRLRTEYVDLYQLHNPPLEILERDEVHAILDTLQREGKIRAYAVSLRSPQDGVAAVLRFGFRCLQVNFNLADQRARTEGLFALCETHDVGVIIRTPLCFGFLTGNYTGNEQFDSLDHRSRWSPQQIRCWAGAYRSSSQGLVERTHQSHAQIALRFCLSYPAVSTTIPGMLTSAHVDENALASDFSALTPSELHTIEQTYRDNSFFGK